MLKIEKHCTNIQVMHKHSDYFYNDTFDGWILFFQNMEYDT